MYPDKTYFRPPPNFRPHNTLLHKNLNSLNFETVVVSLFTGGIGKLYISSDLLSALVVECAP